MIPAAFDYIRPATVAEALHAIQSHGQDGKFLAGGHSLLPMMKLRLATPSVLIDIGKLPELRGIDVLEREIVIGAATTHAELETSEALAEAAPLFRQAGCQIADPSVRNRGTIGGALVNADPSADWPAVGLAYGATMDLLGPRGERSVSAGEFFQGMLTSAAQPDEILIRLRLPRPRPHPAQRTAYRKFRHPASGYAVAAAAVALDYDGTSCTSGRIGITGVSDKAFLADVPARLFTELPQRAGAIDDIADAAFQGIEPMEDRFADAAYRLQLGRTMLRRALADAIGPR